VYVGLGFLCILILVLAWWELLSIYYCLDFVITYSYSCYHKLALLAYKPRFGCWCTHKNWMWLVCENFCCDKKIILLWLDIRTRVLPMHKVSLHVYASSDSKLSYVGLYSVCIYSDCNKCHCIKYFRHLKVRPNFRPFFHHIYSSELLKSLSYVNASSSLN